MNEKLNEVLIEFADVAMTDTDEYEGGADEKADVIGKLCAAVMAISSGNAFSDEFPETNENDDKESDKADENENENENEEETEMSDGCDKKTQDSVEQLASLINDLVDEKLEKFADSQKAELKVISDTYSEVSEALGATFDYSGMSRDELYKFGYETLTGKRLADGMDAVTAFKLVNSKAKTSEKFADSQSTTTEKVSHISEMLKKF